MISRRRLILSYTIQQVIPNICTKFQDLWFSRSWEIFDQKKKVYTHTHTNTPTLLLKDKNCIPPIYFVYREYKNTCSDTHVVIRANFHFPIMTMETLSCHSNVKRMSNAIKNAIFVEANAINISATFPLYPPYGFFLIFLLKFSLSIAMATNQIQRFGQKRICLVEDNSRNISVKLLSKYLQQHSNKCPL